MNAWEWVWIQNLQALVLYQPKDWWKWKWSLYWNEESHFKKGKWERQCCLHFNSQVGLMPPCHSLRGLAAVNSLHTWWTNRLIGKKSIVFQRHPSKKVGVAQALGGACFSPLTLCAISVQAQAHPTDYYTFRWILGKMNPTTSFTSALLMQLLCFSQGKMWCSSCCVKTDVFSCFLF